MTVTLPQTRPLKVLIAEDNIINQRLAVTMLKSLGHTGVVVGDGEKALKCLAKLQFDLLLLDVMMPTLDGMETLAAIRAQEATTGKHLPIIMATAHNEPGDAARLKRAGADGYLAKPLDVDAMQAEFSAVLGQR
jgi:CheY-like chemotaxis protein